jgi:aryl-alcohol dehydrogenase-like predicted oxidoreductase
MAVRGSWLRVASLDQAGSDLLNAGATKPGQVEQNVTAASWALTPEEVAEVDRITGKK